MKVMTLLGTRPEIIRLSQVIHKLDRACQHILVHTGQSFDVNMSDIFFEELKIREPDHYMGVKSDSFAEQVGKILAGTEQLIIEERPDRLLVLGDTNSALSAFVAKRMGVPVYHMEAGNRCYDDQVPEEVNRRAIDHCTDMFMPYTENSRHNLLKEGVPGKLIYVTGNPMLEILELCQLESDIVSQLELQDKRYFLVTLHRQENVDDKARLRLLMMACSYIGVKHKVPVIFSCHPRTAKRLESEGIGIEGIRLYKPFGLRDFLTLEKHALCVLTDSGTVQEECCLLHVRCVTTRETTERPETVECGSNILAGIEPKGIARCLDVVLANGTTWTPPEEYLKTNVSDTVAKIVLGVGVENITGRIRGVFEPVDIVT